MKVKIYVDWRSEEIITEKEYKDRVAEAKADKQDYGYYETDCLSEHIIDWLDKHHCSQSLVNVFNMSERERKEVLDMCHKGYEEMVEQNFESDWDEVEIEV